MSWLGLIKASLLALIALTGWLKARQAIHDAEANILSKQLKGALDEIEQANKARAAVRDSIKSDGVRKPDKFKRPD